MDFKTIIASFLSGILGAMGFGGGSVLIIYLTLMANMPQKNAQGINLIFFIPCALLSVIYYSRKKLINIKDIIPYALFGMTGAGIGFLLLPLISEGLISKLFGIFLALLGIKGLFTKQNSSQNNTTAP